MDDKPGFCRELKERKMGEILRERTRRRAWITVAGVIDDVSDFVAKHPGDRALVRGRRGHVDTRSSR